DERALVRADEGALRLVEAEEQPGRVGRAGRLDADRRAADHVGRRHARAAVEQAVAVGRQDGLEVEQGGAAELLDVGPLDDELSSPTAVLMAPVVLMSVNDGATAAAPALALSVVPSAAPRVAPAWGVDRVTNEGPRSWAVPTVLFVAPASVPSASWAALRITW